MAEYIQREDLKKRFAPKQAYFTEHIMRKIDSIPAADVVERKKGRWELNAPDDFIVYCSECMMPQDSPCNFCPSCGADMRGEA